MNIFRKRKCWSLENLSEENRLEIWRMSKGKFPRNPTSEQETFSLQQTVDTHVFEHLSLQEMATLAHMSPTTFKRKFKSVFDTTYIDYVTQKRMQKAAVMLRDFSRSIAEVAYDCGYQDPGYFSKLFKRWFGHSPRDYKAFK